MTCRALVVIAGAAVLASAPLLISAQTSPASASGHLSGVVVAASDDREPVRRVVVRPSGGGLTRSRSTVTDDLGQFAFDNLPAGRFTLVGSRPGFITSAFGATAPGRPGTPINVSAAQRVTGVTLRIMKGAVITGRVTDADGIPVADVQIALVRARQARTAATLTSPTAGLASNAVTDDRGIYRIFEIEAGEYLVAAGVAGQQNEAGMLTTEQIDVGIRDLQQQRGRGAAPRPSALDRVASYGFAPVYHPSAVDIADASPITVRAGEERTGVDVTLRVIPAVAIEGIVTGPEPQVPQVLLSLAPATPSPLPSNLNARPSLSDPAGPHGKFRYVGVTPGTYVLTARTPPAGRAGGPAVLPNVNPSAPILWAATTVTVAGTDLTGIALDLRPAMTVTGRVAFQATSATPPNATGVRVTLAAIGVPGGYSTTAAGALVGRIPVEAVNAREDAGFQLVGVLPGPYQIGATLKADAAWWLRSAMLAGRDLLDVPLEVAADAAATIGEVQLTFSDRHTELAGTLQTTSGTPAAEHFIVVFTSDRTMWRNGQRRLRSTRPATDGSFSVRDLPPGEYHIAALTDLETPWQTAEFLDQVVPASVRVSIGEGQTVRQDLRLSR